MQRQQGKDGILVYPTMPSTPSAKGFREKEMVDRSSIAFQDTMMAESRRGDGFTDWFATSLASSQFRFSKVRGFNLEAFTNSIRKAIYVPGDRGKQGYVELEDHNTKKYRVYVVGSVEQLVAMLPRNEIEEMAPTALKMGNQLCYIYPER